jgi:hypothetical protein
MLKPIVIVAMFLCVPLWAAAQMTNREAFGVDEHNNAYYLETDNMTRKGYVVYAWQQVNRLRENENNARSTREKIEFDCNFKKYRIMWSMAYAEQDGQGVQLLSEAVSNPSWRPILPDSLSAKILSFACVHVFRPK